MKALKFTAISLVVLVAGMAALAATPALAKTSLHALPLAPVSNSAVPDASLGQSAPVMITSTQTLTGSLQIATAIAKFFNVSPTVVTALQNSGHGYGEIVKAFALARASGKSVDEIFALRAEEQGWGQLLHTLAVSKWDTSFGKIQQAVNAKKASASGNSDSHRENEGKGNGNGGGDDDPGTENSKGKNSNGNEIGSPGKGKGK